MNLRNPMLPSYLHAHTAMIYSSLHRCLGSIALMAGLQTAPSLAYSMEKSDEGNPKPEPRQA